jgi:hypothetical protein
MAHDQAANHPAKEKEGALLRRAQWRVVTVMGAAFAFGLGVAAVKGRRSALEFFAGYLVEQTLSLDNIFVFVMLFDYFQVSGSHRLAIHEHTAGRRGCCSHCMGEP